MDNASNKCYIRYVPNPRIVLISISFAVRSEYVPNMFRSNYTVCVSDLLSKCGLITYLTLKLINYLKIGVCRTDKLVDQHDSSRFGVRKLRHGTANGK
jgi:hypothetical protein